MSLCQCECVCEGGFDCVCLSVCVWCVCFCVWCVVCVRVCVSGCMGV